MDKATKEAAASINKLLGELGSVRRKRQAKQAALDARIQALKDRYGPEIEVLKQAETTLTDDIQSLVVPRFSLLVKPRTKLIELRNGTISMRLGQEAVVITGDEAEIMKRMKRLGVFKRLTRPGKPTLNKDAIKKAPELVARISGLDIARKRSLIIKPSKSQGEIVLEPPFISLEVEEEG